ncbi:MAG: hypothetical protein F6K32_01790 [Desertifilum sp. SIO1I2]|nr:hypothetical protein [Desertifilum sp. SIO1I2]
MPSKRQNRARKIFDKFDRLCPKPSKIASIFAIAPTLLVLDLVCAPAVVPGIVRS